MYVPLIRWSQSSFPDLPWRRERSLYRTLVSEIMLQQTTVGTVKNHYERFLNRFPDLQSLAEASEEELLVAWKGLGYYRRAKNLKKIAETLAREHGGHFPRSVEALLAIPGIGPYTANALLAIGMDQPALAVDANLERVLARLQGIDLPKGGALQKEIQRRFDAGEILPSRRGLSFRAFNEALMDLGRTICQARRAACELCPVSRDCHAFARRNPLAFPRGVATKKKAQEHQVVLVRVVVERSGRVLAYQKAEGEWLAGQWELPTFVVESSEDGFKQYPWLKRRLGLQGVPEVKTGITKYGLRNLVLRVTHEEWKTWEFDRSTSWREATAAGNLSTASLKCLSSRSRR